VPVLPRGARPLKVLHLSDLHLVPRQRAKRAWIRALGELEPDLVINTGDNLAHADSLEPALEALEPLLAIPGAFVMGSNDYFSPVFKNPARYLVPDSRPRRGLSPDLPGAELAARLRAAGWLDLDNARGVLELGGLRVDLVGVDDAHLDRDRYPARPAIGDNADLHLGVTHAPYVRVLDRMQRDGVDLAFAGHTHGGQLCLPGWGALVTNCDLDTGRAKGLHGWPGPRPDHDGGSESLWLHVSAGLGTSPYAPVRFACRPEASLLELVGR
jgi:predicted MPP superfamily phosphohydrolase